MLVLQGIQFAAPILVVALTGVIILLIDSFTVHSPEDRGSTIVLTGLAGLAAALFFTLRQWGASGNPQFFSGLGVGDRFALFFNILFLVCTALTLLVSVDYLHKCAAERGEFYALVFFATTGMMIMTSSTNLVVIFLGLEVMSISFYILAGYLRARPRSVEAAMKYFLMGAFATGIVFYGIVLFYGISKEIDLRNFAVWLSNALENSGGDIRGVPNYQLLLLGLGLLIVGFGFKVASVPFHMWAPDVYEGAPTTITGFMATGVKAAAFGAFLRVLITAMAPLHVEWAGVLWWMAVLTMTIGNLVALTQTNVKRMMAYSSIAHAGYMLIGLQVLAGSAGAAVLYYLVAYAFTTLGVFAIISFFETKEGRGTSLDEYSGLSAKYPLLCAAMTVFMLALGGIPPTAGFMGKFYIFRSAIAAGEYALAGIGILNSLISLFYYLRLVVRMYMEKPIPVLPGDIIPRPSRLLITATAISVAGALWFGFGPHIGFGVEDLWRWAGQSQIALAY